MIQAGVAQIQLMNISAFEKDNGKVARLIPYLYLYRFGYDFRKMVVLDEYWRKDQEKMAFLQMKLDQSEYYPTLSGFYQFQQDAMRNEFNFFNNEKWFTNQMLGIQLEVPIFSSGSRRYKVQQSKLELEKLKVMDDQLQQGLSLKVSTVKSGFNNAYLVYFMEFVFRKIISHKILGYSLI